MGGHPCPFLLIYSTAEQRFVSDEQKIQLLQLSTAQGQAPLTQVPALIRHLDAQVLTKPDWQVFLYRAED